MRSVVVWVCIMILGSLLFGCNTAEEDKRAAVGGDESQAMAPPDNAGTDVAAVTDSAMLPTGFPSPATGMHVEWLAKYELPEEGSISASG